jgi:cytidylate kinase
MDRKYYITIGRQLGSGGHSIGKMLAKKLGIPFYDKELIHIASENSGLGREFFEKADEKSSHSLIGGLLGLRNSLIDEIYGSSYLSNETLFNIQSDIIREIAEQQSAVFVGRCADYILSEKPDCLNIFIHADDDDRIRRIEEIHHLPESKCRTLMQKSDKKRSGYYNYYSCKTWGAAESYHVCINSSLLGIEETVELIRQIAVRRFNLSKGI